MSQSKPGVGSDLDALAARLDALAQDLMRRLVAIEALLRAEAASPVGRLLSVRQKAAQLGCSTDFVRDHWRELGGIELPTEGSRRVLRFPVESPAAAPIAAAAPAPAPITRGPRRRPPARRDLLPVRGRAA